LMPHPLKCSPQGLFGGFSFRGLKKLKGGQNTVKRNLRSEDFAGTLRSESFFTGANLVLRPALQHLLVRPIVFLTPPILSKLG